MGRNPARFHGGWKIFQRGAQRYTIAMLSFPCRRAVLRFALLVLTLAGETRGLGQSPAASRRPEAEIPQAVHLPPAQNLPPLDLNTLALKTGSRFRNCPNVTSVTEAACTYDKVVFDAPTGPDALISQAAHRIDITAYGPGVSLGNIGGWRVNKADVEVFTSAVRGITQAHSLILDKHAAGDTMGSYSYVYSDGGSTALSDESIKGDALDMGETVGYFHGTVAATTGAGDIAPVLKYVSGNNWTTDGAPLLDITKGSISGLITGPSEPLPGSGYLNSFPVDDALPLTTAWGVCGDEIPSNKLVQVNTPVTCNVALKYGEFKAGGTVCVAGPNYPEQAPISAAKAPEGGFQSVTVAFRNPNEKGANLFQGGVCGQYISFDANLTASGYRSSYYAFGALDPHHLIYGMNLKGAMSSLPMASEAERFGVAGRNGYHLYPGCEVITNKSLAADPVCEPNAVPWEAGDVIEAPHNVAVNTVGRFTDVLQNTPANGSLSSGDLVEIHGMGAVGANFIARRTINANSYKIFDRFGGMLGAPDMHRIEGYFATGFSFGDAPGALVRIYGNADGSARPMTLFAMPGGEVTWDPATSTLQAPKLQASNFAGLRGTSERIGGSPLALGSCATGIAKIPGAAMDMVPTTVASTIGAPGFSAQGAFQVSAQVTAPGEVRVNVCALIAGTPKASSYTIALQ